VGHEFQPSGGPVTIMPGIVHGVDIGEEGGDLESGFLAASWASNDILGGLSSCMVAWLSLPRGSREILPCCPCRGMTGNPFGLHFGWYCMKVGYPSPCLPAGQRRI
jgi:hypothetical protein